MLENLPRGLGQALSGLKAGIEKTVYRTDFADLPETLTLTSPAFAADAAMPARFTADGDGLSPPLAWENVPEGTRALAILVEDAGSPTPRPMVHLIACDLAPTPASLAEGALPSPGRPADGQALGKNSLLKPEWLPPDPPTGHGPHAYLFQLYALNEPLALTEPPGRGALVEALRGRVIGKGCLVGTYERR